uniref:AcidPPc domain-containing protein n=1 Tax=Elaeophora elaphi TaxID=1147741 RepID=A0A0R3S2S8_9BILA
MYQKVLQLEVEGLSTYFLPNLYLEPYRRGFYCNDPTIQLPYKSSTISTPMLFVAVFFLPLIGIVITEICRSQYGKELYSWRGFNFDQILVNSVKYYAYQSLGIVLALLINIPTKFFVGELRPIFLDICNPSYDSSYCRNQTYILNYKCRGNKYNHTVKEARLSFFSGHATLAMTVAIFFIIYLQSRIPRKGLAITIKPLVQLFALGLALYTGYTRIIDGMHHLHDVVVGYIVGALLGYITAKYIAGLRMKGDRMRQNEIELQKIELHH